MLCPIMLRQQASEAFSTQSPLVSVPSGTTGISQADPLSEKAEAKAESA